MGTPMTTPITTLDQAAGYLEGLINVEKQPATPYKRLGLEPIRALLARVGNPQDGLSVVHVAGSKGKGSTCLLAECVLRAAGERVGTFTSPHLERWTERFRIDGVEVAGERLADAVERLRPHIDALRRGPPGLAPTFFDATTAAALLLFANAGVDRVLLEVGLGGRLDSTNVVRPAVTCITTIELEHTDKLGLTLAAIAGEKAGILKPGVPCVTGALPAEAARVVAARAAEQGAPVERLGEDFHVALDDPSPATKAASAMSAPLGLRYVARDGFSLRASLPILGAHHAANAAIAIAALRRLGAHDDAGLARAARVGLAHVALPGRVELVATAPRVLVDCAHTPASARALAEVVARMPARRRRLVLSVSADKDLPALLALLLPHFDSVTVTRADAHRSLRPADVAAAVREARSDVELRVVPNPHLALRAAHAAARSDELLCVAGSVYLAGIARRVFLADDGPTSPDRVRVSRRPSGATASPETGPALER